MPDWLPWIFSQISNRKMLDFKPCVHCPRSSLPSPCPMNDETIIQFIFSAKTSRNHNDNSFRCLWLISPTNKPSLKIMGSPDSRLVHDASLCFLCCWIQKPLLFKQMFLFPCSLFDIGPCVKCVMSGLRRQWQWQCRAPLAFLMQAHCAHLSWKQTITNNHRKILKAANA